MKSHVPAEISLQPFNFLNADIVSCKCTAFKVKLKKGPKHHSANSTKIEEER
jgi:hypothetical protein